MNKSIQTKSKELIVSVIIPTFNAQERLSLLLKSLKNQTTYKFEIIIVDDGSTDDTRKTVQQLAKDFPVPFNYYYLNNANIFGAAIARNYGAKQAKGSILLFLDQDCVAKKDLIKKHIKHQKTKEVILGYYAGYDSGTKSYQFSELINHVQKNRIIPHIKDFRDPLFKSEPDKEAWKCFVSAHFSIKKNTFDKFLFDESFIEWGCEDIDLGYRIHQAEIPVHFVKDCIAYNSSQEPHYTKEKFISLSKSLIHMYKKYNTEVLKSYCFERFYNIPLKHRRQQHLSFEKSHFVLFESKSKIIIDKERHSLIVLDNDLEQILNTFKNIIPLIESVHFDVSIIKRLKNTSLKTFIENFHQIIKVLRDNGIHINLEDIRKQSFLAGVRLLGPKRLGICFYNKCNLQCIFCSINSPLRKKKRERTETLSLETVEKILDQAYEMGVEIIRVASDGEPFASPEIHNIFDFIAQKGFELQILTNGTILKKEHLVSLNRIKKQIDILVNLSASKKSTYQKVHTSNSKNYDSVLRSLAILSKLKQLKKKRGENLLIGITYIITKYNYQELSDLVKIAKHNGVDHVYFKFAILYEEAEELLLNHTESEELKTELLKAEQTAKELSLTTNIGEISDNIHDKGFKENNDIKEHSLNLPIMNCYNGWFFGRINSFGDYYICCRETVSVGNIHKSTFKDVFLSKQMKSILDEGASGLSLNTKMWHACNYCYHLQDNNKAKEWLSRS